MYWYYYIASFLIFSQLVLIVQVCRNYRFFSIKYKKSRQSYRPDTALVIPCKGLDSEFDRNISSFYKLDYDNYILWFVVEDETDPAYEALCRIREKNSGKTAAKDIQILIAGKGSECSQKIHNLLHAYKELPENVEVIAFADSDISVRNDWLSQLVYPLRKSKYGVASGYRWFIPQKNNLATLALSAINAKIAQLLGNTRFNQAWGGSMAIRVDVFKEIGLEEIWPKSLSDDLSLSYAVKKSGRTVAFVPGCLVSSYESVTWSELFEFGRRQFLITKVSSPRTWLFGLLASLYSVAGFWGSVIAAIYAITVKADWLWLFIAVPVLFYIGQLVRLFFRQKIITKLFPEELPKIKFAIVADLTAFWIWSFVLLFIIISSAFGRTIIWRGIKYKLLGPTKTIVISHDEQV